MKKESLKILVLFVAIISCIFAFTACGNVEFNVNFIVDEKVYSTISTSGKETIKMPENPMKEDYVFDGWFWDKDEWQKPFTANSLLDAPLSSDMSVYCKWSEDKTVLSKAEIISADGFTFDNNDGFISVSNLTETFSFINKVIVSKNATFAISKDIYGAEIVATKTIPLEIGDNKIYLLVTSGDGNNINLYTMIVRRRPIYAVTFNANDGSMVKSQNVEEDGFVVEPATPTKAGYDFIGWDYDFNKPITENTIISASWDARNDTPYTVEYYLENFENDNYTLTDTLYLTGTTDTAPTIEQKNYEHHTLDRTVINNSGYGYYYGGNSSFIIKGDGSTVLRLYYKFDRFHVSITAADDKVILGNLYNGYYKYGYEIDITATHILGYKFVGWYNYDNNSLLSKEQTMKSFKVVESVYYKATYIKEDEMTTFDFVSTETTCQIKSIIDKTATEIIVPDYVTSINPGAFSNCSSLESITIPFVGGNKKTATDTYQYPFGYIFGTSSYTGGIETKQYFYGSSTSSMTYNTTYYIPSSLKSVTVTGGEILRGAFGNCSGLTSITIGNGVTSIGYAAFYDCSGLTSVYYTGDIAGWCGITFDGNYSNPLCYAHNLYINDELVTNLIISDTVKEIEAYALNDWKGLTSVTIPDSVTSIGWAAFSGCSALTSVTYKGTIAQWYAISKGSYWKDNVPSKCKVYCTDGTVYI